ncbi:biotin/lipoyl-containing protein [Oscillatoria amoena NRMC-F 0135]|nr:biotin/lipoyl-containing protein [Oscillatoria amoena NRMC-F 0135]
MACPLSGVVVTVNAPVGTVVAEGDTVITLEAMKMYTAVCAHKAGTVKEILVNAGQSVDEGQALATIG